MAINRYTGTTYYDFLKKYFAMQYVEPLPNAIDQAVMTHILDLCNSARSDKIKTTLSQIGVKSAQNRRRVGESVKRLADKNYIVVRECAEKMIEIRLKFGAETADDEENSQAYQGVSDSQDKDKDQTRQERNEKNFENENKFSEDDFRSIFG